MMTLHTLSCFDGFTCLAGDCPDTCCQNWEVTVDDETAVYYQHLEGALGERLRALMTKTPDGTIFQLKGGFCPLLLPDGFCSVQRSLGEEHLGVNCALYPRFNEIYGGTREFCLAISCPEAARRLFSAPAPLTITQATLDELPEPNDLDPERYLTLRRCRDAAIAMVQDRSLPFSRRMALLLDFAAAVQRLYKKRCFAEIRALCKTYDEAPARAERAQQLPARARRGAIYDARIAQLFAQMEPIGAPQWPDAVRQVQQALPHIAASTVSDWQYEHLLVYFLYRYFLKAVNDGRIVHRVRGMAICVRMLQLAASVTGVASELATLAYRFSREIEHSEENMEQIWHAGGSRLFAGLIDAME
ncbi:MAG: flagellin lysine-N-methylase [Oscillospiraceae bacterium]|nr:flagellin lysine-N-methylase [Oscillospiraceae bacterium]